MELLPSAVGASIAAGVTVIVRSAPSRSTTKVSCSPGEAWMTADTSAKVDTAVPSTETMTSSGSMPG